jgi:hypothetical protein
MVMRSSRLVPLLVVLGLNYFGAECDVDTDMARDVHINNCLRKYSYEFLKNKVEISISQMNFRMFKSNAFPLATSEWAMHAVGTAFAQIIETEIYEKALER